MEAAKALAVLEGRASAEAARAARIGLARAAASVAPYTLAFLKARAAARDLFERAARLAAELSSLEASGSAIKAKRLRIKECAALAASKQREIFGLQKAVEVWKRRAGALSSFVEPRRAPPIWMDVNAREVAEIDAYRREFEALRPKPEEEAKLRGDLEKLQARGSSLALLSEQSTRGRDSLPIARGPRLRDATMGLPGPTASPRARGLRPPSRGSKPRSRVPRQPDSPGA